MSKKVVKNKKEPFTKEVLLRRNPMPFGDTRKYYLAAKVGTVVLLTLCTYICVTAIAVRTETCEQLSNGVIVCLLGSALLVIVGHYMRSILGYGISALAGIIVVILLQTCGGTGVKLISDCPEYGEVFIKGIQSTDFWVIIAKVLALLQTVLSVVFIRSTLTLKEEPKPEGMNVQIDRFRKWLNRVNDSLMPGRRPLDYWFTAGILFCAMVFIAYNPSMGKYDYYALVLLLAGCVLIACKLVLPGALLIAPSALLRCTMYQYRFGMSIPVGAAYIGMWLALLYLLLISSRMKRETDAQPVNRILTVSESVFLWIPVALLIVLYPVHEFLNVFTGSHMTAEKDSLPLLFFLPLLIMIAARSRRWYGYLFMAAYYLWCWNALRRSTPRVDNKLVFFDCADCHGSIGAHTTDVLMAIVDVCAVAVVVMAVLCVCMAFVILVLRRAKHEKQD